MTKTFNQNSHSGDYKASEISVSITVLGGTYGGGSEVLVVQRVTGTLSPGAHPGSYNGQDAYNDMLIVDESSKRRERTTQQHNDGRDGEYAGYDARSADYFRGGDKISGSTKGNEILQILWETYGTEAILQWGTAIMERLQQTNILQPRMYENGISSKTTERNKLDGSTLICPQIVAEWVLRDMRKQQECGCSSQGWESDEQFDRESSAFVQKLPHKSSSTAKDLFDLWSKGEGIRILQQTLHKIQEIRRSAISENKGGGEIMSVVRRLTPL